MHMFWKTLDWHQRCSPDHTSILPAIGTWGDYKFENPKSYKNVYILQSQNRAKSVPIIKLQILDASNGNYRIRYGKLDGSIDVTYLVQKNQSRESQLCISWRQTQALFINEIEGF